MYSKFSLDLLIDTWKSLGIPLEKTFRTLSQAEEADRLAQEQKIPYGDALHAILARELEAVLVTRDKHFKRLTNISKPFKPETLL